MGGWRRMPGRLERGWIRTGAEASPAPCARAVDLIFTPCSPPPPFPQVYHAVIDAIDEAEGSATVTFTDYGNTDTAALSDLLLPDGSSVGGDAPGASDGKASGGVEDEVDTVTSWKTVVKTAAPVLPDTSQLPKQSQVPSQPQQESTPTRVPGSASSAPRDGGTAWAAGGRCQCVYVRDGRVYNAIVETIDLPHNSCTVLFTSYGNRQFETPLSELMPEGTAVSLTAISRV